MGMLALLPGMMLTYVWVNKHGMAGAALRLFISGMITSGVGWGLFASTGEPMRNWFGLVGAVGITFLVFGGFAFLLHIAYGRRS